MEYFSGVSTPIKRTEVFSPFTRILIVSPSTTETRGYFSLGYEVFSFVQKEKKSDLFHEVLWF
ncbi:MAG: hypothetical protein K6E76_01420 [Patescibacteria group bacterium]|nr:hypothetical protein [Patescibacteria group bacterium]